MRTIKYAVLFALAFVVLAAVGARAGEVPTVNPYLGILNATTSAELPGKAADLVSQAAAKERRQTTIDVVNAAVPLNPAAARVIVGSIAHSSPEMAGTAAATAVALLPDQAVTIASVAAAAAPGEAGKIVEAVCHVVPQDYEKVADAVAEIVPGADKEILTAVATAVPSLKNLINQALLASGGSTPSVDKVLAQVAQENGNNMGDGLASGPSAMGSGHGTFVGGAGGTPSDVPASSGTVPLGGATYSAP